MQGLKRVVFYISFPLSFIAFIFPIYASNLGVGTIEIGFLYTVFTLSALLIRPVVGNMIDKKGRKKGIVTGVALYALVNIFYSLASDFKYLLVARIVQSIAASFLWISIDASISDISNKENRAKNFGIMNQTQAKGEFLGSVIGFNLLLTNSFSKLTNFFSNSFSTVFLVFFITSILSMYFVIKSVPETLGYKKDFESGRLMNSNHMKFFLIIMGIISFIFSLTAPIYLIYLKENITSELYPMLELFIPTAILATFLPKKFGSLADKYGREKIIISGMLMNAILQICMPFVKSYDPFLILYTLISVVGMFYSPALSSIIIDFVGENKRGRSYGLYSFASGVGAAIGPLVGTYIFENIGNSAVFYFQGALLIIISITICCIYPKLNLDVREEII